MLGGDERTLHRLEAFSDIVMGFCLAEVGLELAMPKDPSGLPAVWLSLNAFVSSFVLISVLWWYHHKLFLTYVVLNDATVVMNFIMLGALALGVYFLQVATHFIATGQSVWTPLQGWLASMALVYLLLGLMYAIGIRHRHAELSAKDLGWGLDRAYLCTVGTVSLGVLAAAVPAMAHDERLAVAVVVLIAGTTSLRRVVVPRIMQRLQAARA